MTRKGKILVSIGTTYDPSTGSISDYIEMKIKLWSTEDHPEKESPKGIASERE